MRGLTGIFSIFVASDLSYFAVAAAAAAVIDFGIGAGLHAFGAGKARINQFFDAMENEEQA